MVEFESRDYLFFCQIKESHRQTSRHLPAIKAFVNCSSLRKQPTFGDATNGFPAKWRLRNERSNSILMMCHHPDRGSASDWSCRVGNLFQPIGSTLRSFLRRHFAGKPWVVSPNVGCFFRLHLHVSYLFLFLKMYYRQKGQRTPTRPQAIHDNFDLCAEALVQRLTSYKTQSEEYHNSCIQGK